MKTILATIALTIVFPATAYAHPASCEQKCCCCKDGKGECCKDKDKAPDDHSGHDKH